MAPVALPARIRASPTAASRATPADSTMSSVSRMLGSSRLAWLSHCSASRCPTAHQIQVMRKSEPTSQPISVAACQNVKKDAGDSGNDSERRGDGDTHTGPRVSPPPRRTGRGIHRESLGDGCRTGKRLSSAVRITTIRRLLGAHFLTTGLRRRRTSRSRPSALGFWPGASVVC